MTDAEMTRRVLCPHCHGHGDTECPTCGHSHDCDECGGEGYVSVPTAAEALELVEVEPDMRTRTLASGIPGLWRHPVEGYIRGPMDVGFEQAVEVMGPRREIIAPDGRAWVRLAATEGW